ncbi:membrane protein of unknown function [Cupriavidus taiwanensis]|uniref:EamA domain-containing protein n=1 Tax=Cupriavidus taiwanensis TaxID=164546 RepID=A0A375IBC4_9BURK|nr:membrane protein of unknown function [Cupriavidus taiwanensis]
MLDEGRRRMLGFTDAEADGRLVGSLYLRKEHPQFLERVGLEQVEARIHSVSRGRLKRRIIEERRGFPCAGPARQAVFGQGWAATDGGHHATVMPPAPSGRCPPVTAGGPARLAPIPFMSTKTVAAPPAPADRHAVKASLSILIGASVWGIAWFPYRVLAGWGLGGMHAAALVSAVAAVLSLLAFRRHLGGLRPHWLFVAIGLAAGVTNAGFVWGSVNGHVMRVLLLFYLTPVWTALCARLFLGERLSAAGLALVGLALFGAGLMLWTPAVGVPLPGSAAEWSGLPAGDGRRAGSPRTDSLYEHKDSCGAAGAGRPPCGQGIAFHPDRRLGVGHRLVPVPGPGRLGPGRHACRGAGQRGRGSAVAAGLPPPPGRPAPALAVRRDRPGGGRDQRRLCLGQRQRACDAGAAAVLPDPGLDRAVRTAVPG